MRCGEYGAECAEALLHFEEDVGVELGRIRLGIVGGELSRLVDDLAHLAVDGLQLVFGKLPALQKARRTCSIGSCSSRMRATSSFVRYFAGSDMEWPR